MEVIGPDTMQLTPVLRHELEAGELSCVNGEICRPIEVYADQGKAQREALRRHRRTDRVHKVVLSMDLSMDGSTRAT